MHRLRLLRRGLPVRRALHRAGRARRPGRTTPGVADKCTWCYHRINQGQLPACVEICPVGARKFGDAADETSEIATIVRERAPKQLHPEYGTNPAVLYLGPSVEEA